MHTIPRHFGPKQKRQRVKSAQVILCTQKETFYALLHDFMHLCVSNVKDIYFGLQLKYIDFDVSCLCFRS